MAGIRSEPRKLLKGLARAARTESPSRDEWERLTETSRSVVVLARLQQHVVNGALVFDTATDAADTAWPHEYLEAFSRLRLDKRYGTDTAAGLFGFTEQLSEAQLQGLVSSVKGTVMEIRVREMIDAGELPVVAEMGESARLSESLTQSGHDVEVVNLEGDAVGGVQVKSGDWSGFSGRMDEYAGQDIPVAMTSEAAAAARDAGWGDSVIDTGISGAELTAEASEIIDNLGISSAIDNVLPEAAGLLLLGSAAMRLRAGEPLSDVRRWTTRQLTELGVANAGAVAVEVMTGLIMLRPATALGAKWGLGRLRTTNEARLAFAKQRSRVAMCAVERC